MKARGFTLLELLLVMVIIALLASLAVPVVTGGIHRAKESTLKEDLYAMRKALDDHYADTGSYPAELDDLVRKRYLRRIPVDPLTERRDSWILVRGDNDKSGKVPGIIDVQSGSEDKAHDGTGYRDW